MGDIKKGDHKFYIGDDEQNPVAEITYKEKGNDVLEVDHTYTADELRGQGIAGKLVGKMVEFAKEQDKKIEATCPYAKEKIEKTPEYRDVLAEN
ncbi:GNAT family N-acetyltransferase [Virgibacillus siamensis]|uniref:GNAT family N-acetyltransferase n=1 Tax=Virgibacillus siamensis TaxID=480071 RepID=UPI000986E62A|nr:GNAT family N-acetyltransferase [Virgibacillus siamensis]